MRLTALVLGAGDQRGAEAEQAVRVHAPGLPPFLGALLQFMGALLQFVGALLLFMGVLLPSMHTALMPTRVKFLVAGEPMLQAPLFAFTTTPRSTSM